MKLRTKIIFVFILSLVMSALLFLVAISFLITTPFGGEYSPMEMKNAAFDIAGIVTTIPKPDKTNVTRSLQQWMRAYPNMDFNLYTPFLKVSFGTTRDPFRYYATRLEVKPLRSEPAIQIFAREKVEKVENGGFSSSRQMVLIQLKKGSQPSFQIEQTTGSPPGTLVWNITRSGETLANLVIPKVNNQYYTPINLLNNPNKMWIFLRVLMSGLIIAVVVTSIMAVFFTKNISQRFQKVYQEIRKFELGNVKINLVDNSNDEIGRLTRIFNQMVDKIRSQLQAEQVNQEQRRQLVSNISHDLRTPLTTIIGYTEALENGVYEDEMERRKQLSVIRKKALYMEKLLGEFLDLSRIESSSFELEKTNIDMVDLCREILIEYLPALQEQGIVLEMDFPDQPVFIKLDAPRISRALRNLIDNAIKYGFAGRFLKVAVYETDQMVCIGVTDRGPGICPEEQPKIFDRFYRIDKARTSMDGGVGLGLAISWEIVKKHGGKITVESEPEVETTFTIQLLK